MLKAPNRLIQDSNIATESTQGQQLHPKDEGLARLSTRVTMERTQGSFTPVSKAMRKHQDLTLTTRGFRTNSLV